MKNKTKKIIIGIVAALVVIGVAVGIYFKLFYNAKTPGTGNDKLIEKTPESIGLVDESVIKGAEDVTAITGATDLNGKVVDSVGIIDKLGHKIYATGQKDSIGQMIYTTGKKNSEGKILYTKNKINTFGELVYYTGEYTSDGKLVLKPSSESPDYSSNNTPSKNTSNKKVTTSTTVGIKKESKVEIKDVLCSYTSYFGGKGIDQFTAVDACKDGGYVAVGNSSSVDGDLEGSSKEWKIMHAFIVKYSNDGKVEWKKIFGGNNWVYFRDVAQLSDGSIVAVGETSATDTAAPKNAKSISSYIVRVSKNGDIIWQYSFPADEKSTGDMLMTIENTSDGGFVAGGKAMSTSGFFTGTASNNTKAFIFKFDKNCNIKWRKILTGSKANSVTALAENSDGDIFATCVTLSHDGDFSGITYKTIQTDNTVLMKLNKNGKLIWSDYLQSNGASTYNALTATSDGGCVVAGTYTINKIADGIYSTSYGKSDGYVLRYNKEGKVCWARVVGGNDIDTINSVTAIDGGFVIAGQTKSVSNDFQAQKLGGEEDGYLIYLNEKGETCTTVVLNGESSDSVTDVCTLKDGSVAICGWTKSAKQAFANSNSGNQYIAYASRYTVETSEK